MKVTLHLDFNKTEEWAALIQVEDAAGNSDAMELNFPAPKEDGDTSYPVAFTAMLRTLDFTIQKRIWPERLMEAIEAAKAAAEAEKPLIILPGGGLN